MNDVYWFYFQYIHIQYESTNIHTYTWHHRFLPFLNLVLPTPAPTWGRPAVVPRYEKTSTANFQGPVVKIVLATWMYSSSSHWKWRIGSFPEKGFASVSCKIFFGWTKKKGWSRRSLPGVVVVGYMLVAKAAWPKRIGQWSTGPGQVVGWGGNREVVNREFPELK